MEIVNHNASFREFVYRVAVTAEEIWQLLGDSGGCLGVRYQTDPAAGKITFRTELPLGQPDITYGLTLSVRRGITVLKVIQLDWLWEKNRFAGLQNDFWTWKLEAEPVDYIQYG